MKYEVILEVSGTISVEVEANNRNEAEEKANMEVFDMDFGKLNNIDYEVRHVERLGIKDEDVDKVELVKCPDCGWIGTTDELESGGSLSDPYCPKCGESENIIPLDPRVSLQPRDVEQLWDIFCAMIELTWCGETMYEFYVFPAGTHHNKIEEWFDTHYEGGILALDEAIGIK